MAIEASTVQIGGVTVSVVIVSHNRPALLARAIDSVFAQTYRPIELVLVDNRSDPPIVAPEPPPGITIKLSRTPSVMTSGQSRNIGIDAASGYLIGFLDDDDFYYPEKTERQVGAFQADPALEIAYMNTEKIDERGAAFAVMRGSPHLPVMWNVHLNSIMMRRDIAAAERFDERLTRHVDDQFSFRIFDRYKWRHIDEIGASWVCDLRPDQMTYFSVSTKFKNLEEKFRNRKVLCDQFAAKFNQHPVLRKRYYGRQAVLSLFTFRIIDAVRYGLASIGMIDGPRNNTPGPSP